jgi:hypothetical protein
VVYCKFLKSENNKEILKKNFFLAPLLHASGDRSNLKTNIGLVVIFGTDGRTLMMERRTGELQRNVTPAEWEINENI